MVRELFYKGHYSKILKDTIDHPSYTPNSETLPWAIGALCFTGRILEAEKIFRQNRKQFSSEDLAAGLFFLGISKRRVGEIRQSIKLIRELKVVSKNGGSLEKFFYFQGLAFLRYFSGQFRSCRFLAENSLAAALESQFFYGRMLALDILAHSSISLGQVQSGLKSMSQALSLAESLGHSGLFTSLQVSELNYKLLYGIEQEATLKDINQLIGANSFEDNYSQAYLFLELTRHYTRSGDFQSANKSLEKASTLIYQSSHKKQRTLLSLRMAELEYQRGQFHRALMLISGIKNEFSHQVAEVSIESQTFGLEEKIVKALNLSSENSQGFGDKLKLLSQKSQLGLVNRYMHRRNQVFSSRQTGDDLIGDLKDQVNMDSSIQSKILQKMADKNCLTFALDTLSLVRGQRYLVVNFLPGKVLLAGEDGIFLRHLGRSDITLKLIKALSQDWLDKGQLIELVWEYSYDSFRHDPMLFSGLQVLRKILFPFDNWLLRSEQGYRLDPKISLKDLQPQNLSSSKYKKPMSPIDIQSDQLSNLNYRQIEFLQSDKAFNQAVGIQEYLTIFSVSKITASRDLAQLTNMGFLQRIGKGRATKYIPNANSNSLQSEK